MSEREPLGLLKELVAALNLQLFVVILDCFEVSIVRHDRRAFTRGADGDQHVHCQLLLCRRSAARRLPASFLFAALCE